MRKQWVAFCNFYRQHGDPEKAAVQAGYKKSTAAATAKKLLKREEIKAYLDDLAGAPVLLPQQQLFCEEYLKDFNGTQAAIRAGYSERSAYSQASRLLSHDEVQAYISHRIEEHKMGADEVLNRLADIARGDLGDFLIISKGEQTSISLIGEDGKLNPKTRLIKKLTTRTDRLDVEVSTIELHDPLAALKLLGTHHKLFTKQIEHSGKLDVTGVDDLMGLVYGKDEDNAGDAD